MHVQSRQSPSANLFIAQVIAGWSVPACQVRRNCSYRLFPVCCSIHNAKHHPSTQRTVPTYLLLAASLSIATWVPPSISTLTQSLILHVGTGAISWFPVHCTSINNTNDLISGDNKGVASQFLEKWAVKQSTGQAGSQEVGQLQVTHDFVAAFGQANVGDTSPNIQGAFCQDTGLIICHLCQSTICLCLCVSVSVCLSLCQLCTSCAAKA